MLVVRTADAPRVRWRNDGGWTREIMRSPSAGEQFDWRVSIAEVETVGPFSAFDGYDRVLVLLEGAGMDLRFVDDGRTVHLRPDERRARFAGEAPITATLVDGPTTDFNLIWRRDSFVATARYFSAVDDLGAGGGSGVTAGAHIVHGSMALPDGTELSTGDTVVSAEGEHLNLHGNGAFVAFVVVPRDPTMTDVTWPTGLVVGAKSTG